MTTPTRAPVSIGRSALAFQESGKPHARLPIPRSTQAAKSAGDPLPAEKADGLIARAAWRARVLRLARTREAAECKRARVRRRMRATAYWAPSPAFCSQPFVQVHPELALHFLAYLRPVGCHFRFAQQLSLHERKSEVEQAAPANDRRVLAVAHHSGIANCCVYAEAFASQEPAQAYLTPPDDIVTRPLDSNVAPEPRKGSFVETAVLEAQTIALKMVAELGGVRDPPDVGAGIIRAI